MCRVPDGPAPHAGLEVPMTRRRSTVKDATLLHAAGGARARRWTLGLAVGAVAGLAASLAMPATAAPGHHSTGFRQVNLVSDQPGVAALRDPDLVNAWGLSA